MASNIEFPVKLETLKNLGLDPKDYPTCSASVKGGNIGCRWYVGNKCKVPLAKRGDPQTLGIRMLKKGPNGALPPFNDIKTCYHVPILAESIVLNNGGVKILAYEGETIRMKVEEVEERTVPGEGIKRFYKTVLKDVVVPKHEDKADLLSDALAQEEIDKLDAEEEERRLDELEREAKVTSVAKRR